MLRNVLGKRLRLGCLVASAVMFLSACSVPVPLGDLLPQLGDNKSGQFSIPNISKSGFDLAPFLGDQKAQTLTVPAPEGDDKTVVVDFFYPADPNQSNIIDLSGRDEIQSQLVSLGLQYKIDLTKVGDYTLFQNEVVLQLFLAPSNEGGLIGDDLNKLGEPVVVKFDGGSQTIEAKVDLKPLQIQAINERKLRIAVKSNGRMIDIKSDEAGIRFDILSFQIVDLKVNVDESFPAGDNGDVISIADIDTKGLTVNSLTLDYAATIKQSTPEVLKGIATVELYLAASSETNLYQASNLIKSLDIDISGATLAGSLSVQNPLVADVLANDQVRYGVKIRASNLGIEAVSGNDTEVVFEYDVTKLSGTAGVGL